MGRSAALPPALRKGFAFPEPPLLDFPLPRLCLVSSMVTISKDTPCLFIATVTLHRLPVFRTDPMKALASAALDEARRSGGFALFAYVIMPNHLHALTDGVRKPSETVRFVNGILSRRVIGYLKERGFANSLEKLRGNERGRHHRYSLVDHQSNALLLTSESAFIQRVNYIHQNPVRAGLAARAEEYRWSSARCWSGARLEGKLGSATIALGLTGHDRFFCELV